MATATGHNRKTSLRDGPRLLRFTISGCGALLAVLLPLAVGAQTIVGTVLEEGSDRPVGSALVSLVGAHGRRTAEALSDAAGRFSLKPGSEGEYVIVASRLGYEEFRSPLLALTREGSVEMDLLMRAMPLGLEGLEVSVESAAVELLRSVGHTPSGLGRRWIDRHKIESVTSALRLEDVIRWQGIPGVLVEYFNQSPALSPLCVKSTHAGRAPCALTVLNGVVIDPIEVNQLDPHSIEAIAVLSPSDATTLYGTAASGGAVLIWLR